ncbi:MAG: glucose-6-phosphate isomerase [Deltaproteobacteria bacterium HGW-Deltaproteobacteria-12]|jgi:glucose-6-phosphate isomerase/transaldolase/glucose-6-phosphate isomerase|nr:MAG: glucose-6-phosphate isomerase [Deltaproteobacteria bacterium HGW-Deltaproteobacteria-12]
MAGANIDYALGRYEDAVLQALKNLQQSKIIQRIREHDYTVWKAKPDEISNRLGWLHAPADTLKQLPYIRQVIDPFISEGYKNCVLMGMGGSSLAAEVFAGILGRRTGHPDLQILDTTDPVTISRIAQGLDWEKTIFLVSSKSGTTLETVSLFNYFYNCALQKLGKLAGRNFLIITDPASPLEEQAARLSLRHVFLNDPDIGGRYSALSFTGLVPAAILGIDVKRLLKNAAASAEKEEGLFLQGDLNSSGSVLGAVLGTLAQKGRNKLTFFSPPSWMPFGGWLEQLIAESTGKEGNGILPLCAEPLQEPAVYSNDRLFVVFSTAGKAKSAKVSALVAAGHPVITVRLQNKFQLASQMFLWEMATAVAGHIMGINPFDQPDVEATKAITRRIIDLARRGKERLPEEAAPLAKEWSVNGSAAAQTPAEDLTAFLAGAKGKDYVCLQVYLSPTPQIDARLRQLCAAIREKYRIAVAIGYGPRYLHSTGQLHKGDAGQGLFLQLTADDLTDIAIPDLPGASGSTLTFGALKAAQAAGDRQALLELNRRVIRLHLGAAVSDNLLYIINLLH